MLTRRTFAGVLLLILFVVIGLLGLSVWQILFTYETIDASEGTQIERVLVPEFKASTSELASFAALRNWAQGSWTHYCVLDYSTTEPVVERYGQANGLRLGSVKLDSIFFARPGVWSIILMSEGRYKQVVMPSHQIALMPDIIGRCARIDEAILQLDMPPGDPFISLSKPRP